MEASGQQDVGPALAMIAMGDIPVAMRALDALIKEALIDVVAAGTVQCGQYLILFGGDVEPVQRSFLRALEAARDTVIDDVMLPHAEERILPAIRDARIRWPVPGDALGVIQTGAAPTMLAAVDRALKGAEVDLVELRIADGLGGKAIACVYGDTPVVEAALEHADEAITNGSPEGASTTIIRNTDPEVARFLGSSTRFFKEWRG